MNEDYPFQTNIKVNKEYTWVIFTETSWSTLIWPLYIYVYIYFKLLIIISFFQLKWSANGLKNRANLEYESYFVLRCPDVLEISDDFQLMVISVSLLLQICKVQSRHGLPILEQSKAPTCTPLAMSHPPLKSLPLGVRWILFYLTIVYGVIIFYVLLLSLTIACEVKIWKNDT